MATERITDAKFDLLSSEYEKEQAEVKRRIAELKSPIAALSALMTTTVPAMQETIALLKEKAPYCKIIVGGAVLTQEYSNEIKADYYAKDAMEGVRHCEEINRAL